MQERIELRGDYPYFEDYIGGHGLDEVLESDQLYNEWFSLQPKHIKKELELGIYRVRAYSESNDKIGCFTKTAKENRIKEDNGNIRIEEWEEEAYIKDPHPYPRPDGQAVQALPAVWQYQFRHTQ